MFRNLLLLVVGVMGFAVSGLGQTYGIENVNSVNSITSLPSCTDGGLVYFKLNCGDWNQGFRVTINGSSATKWAAEDGGGLSFTDDMGGRGWALQFSKVQGDYVVALNTSTKKVSLLSSIPFCAIDFSVPFQIADGSNCNNPGGNFVRCGTTGRVYYSTLTWTDQYNWPYFRIKQGNTNFSEFFTTKTGSIQASSDALQLNSYTTDPVYVIMDFENRTIEATTTEPNCGPKITSAGIDPDGLCAGASELTATSEGLKGYTSPYPQYAWYETSDMNTVLGTSSTYSPAVAGNYIVRIYASSTVYAESKPQPIAGSPTISVSPSTLTFAREPGQANPSATVTVSTACVDLEDVTFNCVDANYTVTNNHNGTYTITFKSEDLDDEGDVGNYNTTVTFDDGVGGATPCVLTLNGRIASCIGQELASFDFSTNSIGSTVAGLSITTSMTETSDQHNTSDVYKIQSSNYFGNSASLEGTSGNVFQVKQAATSETTVMTITGLDSQLSYLISMRAGSNAPYGDNIYNVKIGNTTSDFIRLQNEGNYSVPEGRQKREGSRIISGVVSGQTSADIKVSVEKYENGNTGSPYLTYFDDIVISKVCPPEVEITSVSTECESSASFTASATAGTGAIVSYAWYVNNELKTTHTSSSATDVFEPGEVLANSSIVKVVVTDAYGVTAEATYTTNCGPDVSDITTPARICEGGDLTIETPTVTPKAGTSISEQGWEYASSPTSNEWEEFDLIDVKTYPTLFKDKYIRYYAIDNTGKKGKSNAVQVTMFRHPEVGSFVVDDICDGESFVLPSVGYTVYADSDKDGDAETTNTIWQYSTASNFSASVETLTDDQTFNAQTYPYYIRYGVTDECGFTEYSPITSAHVNNKTITPSYETYMRVAGMTNVVVGTSTTTSTCVGDLEYNIISGNDNEYFLINPSTGEITLAKVAPAGSYPMTVSVTDGEGLTRTVNITVTLTATPTLTVDGCMPSDVYVYTNQPLVNTFSVGSGYVNGDIRISLSGSAATSFSLSQTLVDKNTVQGVTATLASPFTSAGDRTLTFTAHDTDDSDNVDDETCTTTIHVVELSLRDYVDAQTSCNSTANTLRVVATGVDATHLPLTYQWYKDNVAIPGATSSSYTPTKAGSGNGAYHCVVSTNGNVIHTTDKANISFVEGVPELTFNENTAEGGVEIPSEVFCSQEVGAVMKVTFDGEDVTNDYDRFWWINNHSRSMEGISETGVHTYSFDCDGTPYTATIGAYIRDNASGCVVAITKDVTVKAMERVFYYCGPTGDASDVTTVSNWCTSPSGTAGSCTSPENFTTAGSQYIINKDDVRLKSDQTWNVSGEGSKITVGDGNWNDFTSVGNDWQKYSPNGGYGIPNSYGEYIGSFTGQSMQGQMTKIGEHDYRNFAKDFTIEGTLNTYDAVSVDVKTGSAVKVTTTAGNFAFGELATDEITHMTGNANGYYNIVVKPGSSVTYSGDGAKNIRSGNYSQLYIQDVATDNSGDIAFATGATVNVAQVLKNATSVSLENINPNSSTIQYIGTINQEVAPLKYYNLRTESASNKTLVGDIEVTNSLGIGAGSTLVAGDNDITITGSGEHAVEMVGHFNAGTSTFTYASGSETTVEAMNYYSLDLGNGNRTLSDANVIGVAKDLIVPETAYTYIVDGSTVEFNGNEKQIIPAFTFYNLAINDTAMRSNTGSSLNEAYFLELSGDVTVQNNVILTEGVLDTDGHRLILTNPASSAIGQGYYTSARRACYINGAITHSLPENLSSSATIYYFPVGDGQDYKPLMLNSITTTTDPQVTVGVEYDGVDGRLKEEGVDVGGISTTDAWHVEGNAGYTNGSVGVSKASGLAANINALAYGATRTGEFFEDIYGSEDDGSILYSQIRPSGYYALISRDKTNKTYYYDCSGGKDITDIESWHVEENGGGARATRFDEIDAKWIIKCGTTINAPLVINGSNSVVEIAIPKGDELIVSDNVEFITATVKKGTVRIASDGEMTVDYGFKMEDVGNDNTNSGNYTNRSTLINNGRVNLYLADVVLTNSVIINNGYLYSENVNWDLSSPGMNQAPNNVATVLADDWNVYHHTQFINNSKIEMINANMYVTDAGGGAGMVHVRNASDAVWLIDNTNKAGASFVDFEGVEFAHSNYGRDVAYVDFQCNSTFVVKHTDMTMKYKGNILGSGLTCPAWIGGDITVEDGNMTVGRGAQGGGTFTLEQTCGNIYLKDTDNSGDGIFSCYGSGGYTVNIAGTLYAMGVTVSSGASGSSFNIKDDGTVFIGNIGANIPTYTWVFSINVEDGGTLYYCGNRSSGADNVGSNNGQLYYAGNYYYGTDPIAEADFTNSGNYEQMYASEEQCMAAYRQGLPDTNPGSLLPIELTLLYGICVDENTVELRWQTASETNNSYFVILRSFDGVHFEEIGTVAGAGTTTEMHNYEYYDTDDNNGIVYYKLRQVDYDGNYTDSKVIAVQTCGKNARFSIGSEEIEVFFRNPQANYVVITSVTGQIFYSKKFTNVEEARIAVPQRKGIYIISVIDSKQITSEKFIR